MLFAIDVGNTNMTIGVFDGDGSRKAGGWRRCASERPTRSAFSSTRLFEQSARPARGRHGIVAVVGRAAADPADGGDVRPLLRAAGVDGRCQPTPACRCSISPPATSARTASSTRSRRGSIRTRSAPSSSSTSAPARPSTSSRAAENISAA